MTILASLPKIAGGACAAGAVLFFAGPALPDPAAAAAVTAALAPLSKDAAKAVACAASWPTQWQPGVSAAAADATLGPAVQALVAQINQDQGALSAVLKQNAADRQAQNQRCAQASVLCLDAMGQLLPGEEIRTLVAGDVLQVDVIGNADAVSKDRVHLHFIVTVSNDSITDAPLRVGAAKPAAAPGPAPPTDIVDCLKKADADIAGPQLQAAKKDARTVLTTAASDAIVPGDTALTILFTRDPATALPGIDADAISVRHTFDVDPGKYVVDFGVMLPVTLDRSVQAVPDLASGQRRLYVKYNARINPAFVINVYPAKRDKGRISSWDNSKRIPDNLWGFQLGMGLDFASHPFGELYGGLLCTPVTGISLSFGLALVNEQILHANDSEGMYLPRGQTYTPDTQYMPWPYGGVSATLDFLDLIHTGVQRAQKF
jgi:hypothetical protein